jgi:hypothetical protein
MVPVNIVSGRAANFAAYCYACIKGAEENIRLQAASRPSKSGPNTVAEKLDNAFAKTVKNQQPVYE